ncbi:MAG: type I DNA topoisomerase, partial [Salinispira sp.]
PQTAADIPASKKDLPWARLGIDVDNDFAPLYTTPKGKGKIINALKRRIKEARRLYLATDEDREGESISWHLIQILKPEKLKIPVKRMVFHEITRTAITDALNHTRDVDMDLVRAQETRRVLDRLYGFTLSPLIWKKIAFGLSAGRVQSPGLRMIVERERLRMSFVQSVFWDIRAVLRCPAADPEKDFEARLTHMRGKRLVSGKDFNPETGLIKNHLKNNSKNHPESHMKTQANNEDILTLSEADTTAVRKALREEKWRVINVKDRESQSHPSAPFITSTLQQDGNRKLGMSARETMRAAQRLYEEGFITYMRTDSPTLSAEAIRGARNVVTELFGEKYLSPRARQFSSKSRNAQEAHEAIRPAGSQFTHPDKTSLSGREKALYELIWKRTLATQMASAVKSGSTVKIQAGDAVFQANGTKILFQGFLKLYMADGSNDEAILPDLKEGQVCAVQSLENQRHETKPPARYTEASLIQNLEKLGIGRPSTYSSIIGILLDRNYVRKNKDVLIPSFIGMAVTQFLEKNFAHLITYTFTSDMETSLDRISTGDENNLNYLRSFYCGSGGLKAQVDKREAGIQPEESRKVVLPRASGGAEIRVGRFGPYIVADGPDGKKIHSTIPEEIAPADLSPEDIKTLIDVQIKGPEPIGRDPETDKPIFCLSGRYGFYVQLGEVSEEEPKPRRASVPRNQNPREITLEDALKYLSIPRILGTHPKTGTDIVAGIGRFGPFVTHDGNFRSLKKDDDVYSIGRDRALELLNEAKSSQRRQSTLIKELGDFDKKKIALYSGKYGPYIKFGTKNIPLPGKEKNAEYIKKLSLKECVDIIRNWKK